MPQGLQVEITASGFLYRMVRHMVGALVAVGRGQLPPQRISQLLALGSAQVPGALHDIMRTVTLWVSALLEKALGKIWLHDERRGDLHKACCPPATSLQFCLYERSRGAGKTPLP